MTDVTQALERARALEAAATKGPWDTYFETGLKPFVCTYTEIPNGYRSLDKCVVASGFPGKYEDLELIAHTRNQHAAALDVIDAAYTLRRNYGGEAKDADLDRLEDALEAWASAVLKGAE